VRTYGQFCPIARASEILAERWTPIILRNLVLGCTTFTEIADGAPGLSRALLSKRLRELEEVGVIASSPKADGHGSNYELTPAGQGLRRVLDAMAGWADQWMEVTYDHADPDAVLWSWCTTFLRADLLPAGRMSFRFEFAGEGPGYRRRLWLLLENGDLELCRKDPGFEESLIIRINNTRTFARWHLGLASWDGAIRSGEIEVRGPTKLARALPSWNGGPEEHTKLRSMLPPRADHAAAH
jgi:DNA-binding HxlR family transcriptional regulator